MNASSPVAAQDPHIADGDDADHAASAPSLNKLLQRVHEDITEDPGRVIDGEQCCRVDLAVLPPSTGVDISALRTEEFTFVRIFYSDGGRQGSSWRIDFPGAEYSFTRLLAKYAGLNVDPESVSVALTDAALSEYPFIYVAEGGNLRLNDEEAGALRDYLLGGGFLMVDDFWGDDQWASLTAELKRVFPDRDPIELWPEHEIFFSYYSVSERRGVPSISSLLNGNASENPDDAVYRGLLDYNGRLMAIFLHNMDFGDAWEHSDNPNYPKEASWGGAIPMGINIVVYALTH